MKFDRLSRRHLLQGASGVLVLPLMPSLMPKAWAAPASKSVRYVQIFTPYGPSGALFYGVAGSAPAIKVSPHVTYRPLSGVTGTISPMIGAGFNAYKAKFSLILGLDTLVVNANHNRTFASCAASMPAGPGGDSTPPVTGQLSVDSIIAGSSKVYGPEVPRARKQLVLAPMPTDGYSNIPFSWQKAGTKLEQIRPLKQTQALFEQFASGFGTQAPVSANESTLLNAVMGDYRALRDGSRLSLEDKQKLESYVSLINDIEKNLQSDAPRCPSPSQVSEADVEKIVDNQFRIMAAAMACDLTRVVSMTLGMSDSFEKRHAEHHSMPTYGPLPPPEEYTGVMTDFVKTGERVARLIKIFDSTPDGAGTLLDNSLLYWCSQYGLVRTGDAHTSLNMPVFVAGGAGGALAQGNLIDYRHALGGTVTDLNRKGLPINNLLVTFMNAMGLSSSDYETTAGGGYGYYAADSFATRPNPELWGNQTGRRTPLPILYKGVARG